nr:sigma 54-interacting transcriptional regulator [Peribacillus sp. TH27]
MKLRLKIKESGHIAKYKFNDIISKSSKIEQVKKQAKKMALSDSNVLIIGESGTGKELFANSIHNYSSRNPFPFVAVNCSALPDNLLESELFGYEEGAFTGAKRGGKKGLFEQAHRGTIFLDEIGDISSNLQSRLLRVLQQKEVLRVGGTKVIPVDVRVIAATNKDLFHLVQERQFRDDLYYRLKVLQLNIPPLRERVEDIFPLIKHFMFKKRTQLTFSSEAQYCLESYNWPGNIRELENMVECLGIMADGEIIETDLPFPNLFFEEDRKNKKEYSRIPVRISQKELQNFLITSIHEMNQQGIGAGRRSLMIKAKYMGIYCSEMGVRQELKDLEEKGYITIGKGRSGCSITQKGLSIT